MMKTLIRCIFAALAVCLIASCHGNEPESVPVRRVVLMYACAYNNLSYSIADDVDELCAGAAPGVGSCDILLVYTHNTAGYRDYKTATNPVLFRAYKDLEGKPRRDTVIVYPSTDISSTVEVMHKVLCDVQELFPARSYGMIFSSHGKGWVPPGYKEADEDEPITWLAPREPVDYSATRHMGDYANTDQAGYQIDIKELVGAIPMQLDFFILDACLMGCVEFAYELKDKCRMMIVSPTEILKDGLIYSVMTDRLLVTAQPDLKQICVDYADFYTSGRGIYPYATVTLVDCTRLDALATVCKELIAAHGPDFPQMSRNSIQPYFYNSLHWFYDLRDIFAQAGASEAELARLDSALNGCIPYHFATPKFFNVSMERVCGLSMYFPYPDKTELNSYYKTLSWNKAPGLIQ